MVRTWDLATGREETRFHRSANVVAVAVAPDGRTAICGGEDKVVSVWRLTDPADHAGRFPRVRRRPYEHGC